MVALVRIRPAVYGDNAYGTGEFQERLAEAGIESRCKTQRPTAAGGLFTKDAFNVDLDTDTVTCPNGKTAPDPAQQGRLRGRPVREGMRRLPVAGPVHQGRRRAQHQGRPSRAPARRGPAAADRPGLDRRLPGHPAQGGTQDRAPDAPPARRPPGPGPRPDQDRRRLRPARRRGQPGTPRHPRRHRTVAGSWVVAPN